MEWKDGIQNNYFYIIASSLNSLLRGCQTIIFTPFPSLFVATPSALFSLPPHTGKNATWTPYLPSHLGDLILSFGFKYSLHADNSEYLSPEGPLLWILNSPSEFHIKLFLLSGMFLSNKFIWFLLSSLKSLFKCHLLSEVFSDLLV